MTVALVTDAARRRAEACFAVARSATFEGERAAAIGRGKAIVEAAGLSLDDFDVPGRKRRGFFYTADNFRAVGPDHPAFDAMLQDVIDELNRRRA